MFPPLKQLKYYSSLLIKLDAIQISELLDEAPFMNQLCLLNEKIPEPILTEWDIISWKNDKYKNSLTDYRVTPRYIRFKEHPDFKQKIEKIREMELHQLDEEIYLKAMDYITPRTQTLYNLYYE